VAGLGSSEVIAARPSGVALSSQPRGQPWNSLTWNDFLAETELNPPLLLSESSSPAGPPAEQSTFPRQALQGLAISTSPAMHFAGFRS
jgi:hypothetical protein